MLFERLMKEYTTTERDATIQSVMKYMIKSRNRFFDKQGRLTKEEKEDMEMDMYMLLLKKYDSWDKDSGTKFLTYIYSSFWLTFNNFIITNLTGINVKRWDMIKHKKATGEQLMIHKGSIEDIDDCNVIEEAIRRNKLGE